MNYLKFFITALFIFASSFFSLAQSVSLELTVGSGFNEETIQWGNHTKSGGVGITESKRIFSAGVSGQIYHWIYLKTEFGTNSTQNLFDLTFIDKAPTNIPPLKTYGWYSSDYFYIAFLPEARLFKKKWFYANAGLAFYKTTSQNFKDYNYDKTYSLASWDNETSSAFVFNIGFNPRFKNIGLIYNIGYHNVFGSTRYPDIASSNTYRPYFSFSQINFKIGVSYTID